MNGSPRNGGFTLAEAVITLGLFMLITLGVVNLTAFASRAAERVTVSAELLENARIAMDMMSVYLRAADDIVIHTDADKTGLRSITLKVSGGETRTFRYNSLLSPSDLKYHRLEFGGNELASYIARISIRLDGSLLTLSLVTDERIGGSSDAVEPVSLTMKLRLYNPIEVR